MAKSYVVPFVLYLLGTSLIAYWPSLYPVGYSTVVLVVGLATAWLLHRQNVLKPHMRVIAACLMGLAGIAVWIGLSELALEQKLAPSLPEWMRPKPRVGFNPHEAFSNPVWLWGFVAVRVIGLAVLVPVAEELFWRGFLARWLKDPNWEQVPLGAFSPGTFLAVVALFTLAHPEWLAAAAYCTMLNWLLIWKRDLWSCIIAHAVSNFVLAAYILTTGSWELW